jgi:RNA-binding protein YhbY
MHELTGSDRRHLRRLAHALDPVVQIGAAGVTPAWSQRSIARSKTTSS